jgi:hypothetical protein
VITCSELHSLLEYRDGVLYRKVKTSNRIKIGDIAGSLSNGYLLTRINGKKYSNHRIIFLMFHGYLPKCIDHIDGNRSNNKIENLREASLSQNQQNAKTPSTNTSGAKGVSWKKEKKKWMVQVSVNGKLKFFGHFEDLELADLVAQEARNKFHGNFSRHI